MIPNPANQYFYNDILINIRLDYYNVYIDDRNLVDLARLKLEETQQLSLIGSTRIHMFQSCIKLDESYRIESGAFSQPSLLSFDVYVQPVDELFSSLQTGPGSNTFRTNVQVPAVRNTNDQKLNSSFIDTVLFDFECFNFE